MIDLSIDRLLVDMVWLQEIVRHGLWAKDIHWGAGTEAVAEVLAPTQIAIHVLTIRVRKEQESTDMAVAAGVNRWRKA